MSQKTLSRAWEVRQDAYQAQMEGDYDRAVELYRASVELFLTAEAHTFLGWTYHFQGKLDEAIAECKRAIEIDPEFGNPYNDIGAYMIEMGRFEEAIPWLERAIEARRYEPRHFPHYNLGRAYLGREMYGQAMRCFQEALQVEPRYSAARQALESLRRRGNSRKKRKRQPPHPYKSKGCGTRPAMAVTQSAPESAGKDGAGAPGWRMTRHLKCGLASLATSSSAFPLLH